MSKTIRDLQRAALTRSSSRSIALSGYSPEFDPDDPDRMNDQEFDRHVARERAAAMRDDESGEDPMAP